MTPQDAPSHDTPAKAMPSAGKGWLVAPIAIGLVFFVFLSVLFVRLVILPDADNNAPPDVAEPDPEFGKEDQFRIARARTDVRVLEKAIIVYELTRPDALLQDGDWQPLLVPMDGQRPVLEAGSIIDPWGRPYQFSTSQRSPTGKPKVWTPGPPGGNLISNW